MKLYCTATLLSLDLHRAHDFLRTPILGLKGQSSRLHLQFKLVTNCGICPVRIVTNVVHQVFHCLNPELDVHLTNVAVQKNAPDYDPEKGCKWSTQQLRKYLSSKYGVEAVSTCMSLSITTPRRGVNG